MEYYLIMQAPGVGYELAVATMPCQANGFESSQLYSGRALPAGSLQEPVVVDLEFSDDPLPEFFEHPLIMRDDLIADLRAFGVSNMEVFDCHLVDQQAGRTWFHYKVVNIIGLVDVDVAQAVEEGEAADAGLEGHGECTTDEGRAVVATPGDDGTGEKNSGIEGSGEESSGEEHLAGGNSADQQAKDSSETFVETPGKDLDFGLEIIINQNQAEGLHIFRPRSAPNELMFSQALADYLWEKNTYPHIEFGCPEAFW